MAEIDFLHDDYRGLNGVLVQAGARVDVGVILVTTGRVLDGAQWAKTRGHWSVIQIISKSIRKFSFDLASGEWPEECQGN